MPEQGAVLTIEELAERVGVPVRTVRFYISEGLLPGPGGRGKAATYGEDHLFRLLLIRRLAEEHLPLKEIVQKLSRLSLDEIRDVLAEDLRHELGQRQGREPSPKDYISGLLARARLPRDRSPSPSRNDEIYGRVADDEPPLRSMAITDGVTMIRQRLAERSGGGGGLRESSASSALGDSTSGSHSWQRWELTPGVELHIRNDVVARQRVLIERVLRAAGKRLGF